MAKMPMTRNPNTGKMQPTFSMDGKGKMAKGGTVKQMAKGGALKMAKGGAAKPMAKGGSVKMRGGGMAKGYSVGGGPVRAKPKPKAKMAKGSASGGVKRVAKKTVKKRKLKT